VGEEVTTLFATRAPSLFDGLGGEPTLDQVIASVWEGLAAHATVACPVCEAQMKPEYGVHPRPTGGRCTRCGSTLT
jgi:hypothetical protein